MIERNWSVVIERLAKMMHNTHMADEWDDLPPNGIERAAWVRTASAMVGEMQSIINDWKAPLH